MNYIKYFEIFEFCRGHSFSKWFSTDSVSGTSDVVNWAAWLFSFPELFCKIKKKAKENRIKNKFVADTKKTYSLIPIYSFLNLKRNENEFDSSGIISLRETN